MAQDDNIQVDLSRATMADFMQVMVDSNRFLEFADKVVIGGITELSLEQLPQITQAVLKHLNRLNADLKKQVELLQTMNSIEDFLDDSDGEDDDPTG